MSTDTTTAPETTVETVEFEKGSWQHTLQLSATADTKVASLKVLAGKRLWLGTVKAVEEFIDPANETDSTDPSGETLASRIKPTGLSASTISKIKNVALAARDRDDFDFEEFVANTDKPSLDKADKRVRALVKAEAQPEVEAEEDNAVDTVIQAVAEVAPKTSTTVEGLLQIALSKAGDVDEFVKVLVDVLSGPTGEHNEAACRAFIRSFAAENAGRVKASKPAPATTATRNAEKRAASTAGDGAAKAKPAPTSASKGDPNKKALPPRAEATATEAPAEDAPAEDLWDEVDAEASVTETVEVEVPVTPAPAKATPVKAKAKPVARKA